MPLGSRVRLGSDLALCPCMLCNFEPQIPGERRALESRARKRESQKGFSHRQGGICRVGVKFNRTPKKRPSPFLAWHQNFDAASSV